MKIIKPPTPRKQWSTTVTCTGRPLVRKGCGAELEIVEDDMFRVVRPYSETVACVQCPTCKVWSEVADYPAPAVLPDYNMWTQYQNIPETEHQELQGYYISYLAIDKPVTFSETIQRSRTV